jgi:hypothetical protein
VSLLKKSPWPTRLLRVADLAARVAKYQGLDVFAGEALSAVTMAAPAPASAQVPAG